MVELWLRSRASPPRPLAGPAVAFLGLMNETSGKAAHSPDGGRELSEEEKRQNVIRLVFGGDESRFKHFCDVIRAAIPLGVGAVLRGSAVTGARWKDGSPFDADGPGTSDLDLTLVGGEALAFFRIDGFYIPGLHSRPLTDDEDPAIAPELVSIRQKLMMMVGRPVNIQATGDLVMFLRGDLLGQPYLTLVARPVEHT
jgi:hypothetical protein